MVTTAAQTAKPATVVKPRRKPRIQNGYAWLLLTPGLLSVLLLAVWPMVLVGRNSFATSDQYGAVTGGFTFESYLALFDPVYAKTMGYSLGIAAINTVLCLIIGYIVSNYIVAQSPQRQSLLLLLLIVPFWTDFLVRTFAWITLLGNGGPILWFAHLLGIPLDPLVPSQTAVMLALIYAFLPTAVFPIYASMRGIDPSLKEAATDLGCGWWQTHARVIAPLSTPGIIGAALLTFVPTLGVFVIPVLLGGGKELLVGNLIVTLYTEFRNQPMGAALSMVLLVLMLLSIAIGALLLKARKRSA
ncbi:ABC transporter permease [Homoserinimonas sp. OAct 916]|uniref:ABC transporter permease n=1 Tax=Homoserinimonas sp. OAct 916 TaxID=2211450 RepID=UPI000DBE50D9|nr:ABC transporter permease [Homoserinimonas sp. OAct 916]